MLKEHGGGQYDVCHLSCFGHELLMHTDKKILSRKTLMHPVEIRRYRHGIGVLNKERGNGWPVFDVLLVSGQDSPNAGLIQHPHIRVQMVQTLQQRLIPMVDVSIAMKSPTSLVAPTAGNGSDGKRRMHAGSAVALPGKTVAKAKKSLGRFADHPGQGFNLAGRHAADVFRPCGIA